MSDESKTRWEFEGDDNLSKVLAEIDERFSHLEKTTAEVDGVFDSFFTGLTKGVFAFNQIIEAGERVADAIAVPVEAFSEYETKLADLRAITGVSIDDANILGASAKQLGVDFNIGAAQGIEAYKLLASNIDIESAGGIAGLQELEKQTLYLAKAAGVDLPQAANTMASSINQFELGSAGAARVINVLGAGAKYGAAEIPDLAASLKNAGSSAATAGISIEATVGALEILSQNAVKGGEAGTDLRNVITKLQTELGIDVGKVGLSNALSSLMPKLHDVTFLTKTFGAENINSAQILIKNAAALAEMTAKVTGTNVAYEQAAINMSTLAQDWEHIKAKVSNAMIDFGAILAPYLVAALETIGNAMDWIVRNSDDIILGLKALGIVIASVGVAMFISNASLIAYNIGLGILNGWVTIVTAAQWLWNAAMTANPIGVIVVGIGLLIAGLVVAYEKFATFRAILGGVMEVSKVILDIYIGLGKAIIGAFTLDPELIKSGWEQAANGVQKIMDKGVGGIFKEGFDGVLAEEAAQKIEDAKKKAADDKKKSSTVVVAGSQPKQKIDADIKAVNDGGRKVQNFTVNIQKLVEKIVYEKTTVTESTSDVESQITAALIRAIKNTEIAIGNE